MPSILERGQRDPAARPTLADRLGRWVSGSPILVVQGDRDELVRIATVTARKRARIVGVTAPDDFIVETDRGPMTGQAGDLIVTNHPDDDTGSDLWTISQERYESTYEPVVGELPANDRSAARRAIFRAISAVPTKDGRGLTRHDSLAITALEDALLRLSAEEIL